MIQAELVREIVLMYQKHGWQLRQLLVRPQQRNEIVGQGSELWEGVLIKDSEIEALWFSRPSQNGREAWELRLLAETAYALFETFEPDEEEELREEARTEMERRMIARVKET